jgi:hypothetical protein
MNRRSLKQQPPSLNRSSLASMVGDSRPVCRRTRAAAQQGSCARCKRKPARTVADRRRVLEARRRHTRAAQEVLRRRGEGEREGSHLRPLRAGRSRVGQTNTGRRCGERPDARGVLAEVVARGSAHNPSPDLQSALPSSGCPSRLHCFEGVLAISGPS